MPTPPGPIPVEGESVSQLGGPVPRKGYVASALHGHCAWVLTRKNVGSLNGPGPIVSVDGGDHVYWHAVWVTVKFKGALP